MRIGSLFSGAGGLDIAVQAVFGGEIAWHCENDAAASRVLAYRYPGTPNLHDITAVDWSRVEPVDVLCGGWPCQPWSIAGAKKGAADERALWPYVADAVRALRPRIVVLENVPNIIVLGELARAVGDLAAAGYDAQWASLRAADLGAPHHRERVFILAADTNNSGCGEQRGPITASPEFTAAEHTRDSASSLAMLPTPQAADGNGGKVSHPDSRREHGHSVNLSEAVLFTWGKFEPAVHRWEAVTRKAPAPTEPNRNGNPRLAAAFSEWMLGWPEGWVTQVPGISRNDQLRIIGNGVVPQQCAAALRYLLSVAEAAA